MTKLNFKSVAFILFTAVFIFSLNGTGLSADRDFYFSSKKRAAKSPEINRGLQIIEEKIPDRDYELIAHIDCGSNDKKFKLKTSGNDIGRVHYEKDYTQACYTPDKFNWDYNHYFSYEIPVNNTNEELRIVFLDADNADRSYMIVVNDKHSIVVNHAKHTSKTQPDAWKLYNLIVPREMNSRKILKIKFDHVGMKNYSPALSDIWVYIKKLPFASLKNEVYFAKK